MGGSSIVHVLYYLSLDIIEVKYKEHVNSVKEIWWPNSQIEIEETANHKIQALSSNEGTRAITIVKIISAHMLDI